MDELPESLSSVLIPFSERSVWDTAIRITSGTDPAAVLSRLARALLTAAAALGSHIRLYLEPTGDACDSGNWVDIGIHAGAVWAEMTPHPQRFGGAVPPPLDAELELAGWVAVGEGPDGDPYDHVTALPAELVDLEPERPPTGVLRRLVADADDHDLHEWADLVSHGVQRVIAPPDARWFLHATVEVLDTGPLHDQPFASTPYDGEWSIDLGRLLRPERWERAVWRPETEAGAICCGLGLHDHHEPPCPQPPNWLAREG